MRIAIVVLTVLVFFFTIIVSAQPQGLVQRVKALEERVGQLENDVADAATKNEVTTLEDLLTALESRVEALEMSPSGQGLKVFDVLGVEVGFLVKTDYSSASISYWEVFLPVVGRVARISPGGTPEFGHCGSGRLWFETSDCTGQAFVDTWLAGCLDYRGSTGREPSTFLVPRSGAPVAVTAPTFVDSNSVGCRSTGSEPRRFPGIPLDPLAPSEIGFSLPLIGPLRIEPTPDS